MIALLFRKKKRGSAKNKPAPNEVFGKALAASVSYIVISLVFTFLVLVSGWQPLVSSAFAAEKSEQSIFDSGWMSSQREDEIGKEAAAEVESKIGIVDAPSLSNYISKIGKRLTVHARRSDIRFQFQIVEMQEANAFALPGGYIYLSRGLLALVNSEDELANILAHEIAHVDARHAAQRELEIKRNSILSIFGAIAGIASGNPNLIGIYGAGLIAKHDRDQERDADRFGQTIAKKSNYNPAAMSRFLRTLENQERLTRGASRRPGFFDTHPPTSERIAGAEARLRDKDLLPHQNQEQRRLFLEHLTGLIVGDNPSEGVFRGSRFFHPDLNFTMRFPDGWRTHNSRSAVVAISPHRTAMYSLELDSENKTLEAAASAFVQERGLQVAEAKPLRIGGFAAYQITASLPGAGGSQGMLITWIQHQQRNFRIVGVTRLHTLRKYLPTFQASTRTFRHISPDARNNIRVGRLRVAIAEENESLEALSARVQNRWSIHETALANGVQPSAQFPAGTPIKVVIEEPYASATKPAPL